MKLSKNISKLTLNTDYPYFLNIHLIAKRSLESTRVKTIENGHLEKSQKVYFSVGSGRTLRNESG